MWIKAQNDALVNSDYILAIYQRNNEVHIEMTVTDGSRLAEDKSRVDSHRVLCLGQYQTEAAAGEELKNIFRAIKDNTNYYVMRTPRNAPEPKATKTAPAIKDEPDEPEYRRTGAAPYIE